MSIPNGVAARMAPFVSPLSASGPPPPASNRATASAAIITPQVSLIRVFGFRTPPADMLPSTIVPASAPATKKMKTRKSATSDVSRASGYCPRNSNSAMAAPSLATASPRLPPVWLSSRMLAAPDARRPEDGEPDHREEARADQHPDDELPDGAAPGDAGDEGAHVRAPGDPRRPEEDGPATQPLCLPRVEGAHPEALRDDVGQVDAELLREGVELEERRSDDEEVDEQDEGQVHARLAQVVDPLVYRCRRRKHVGDCGDGDDDQHQADPVREPEDLVEPRGDLKRAKPQRDGDTEQRGQNRQDVDRLSYGTVDAVADQGAEDRAD